MMMTCRLLCALLVLALYCCCPSVCGADAQPGPQAAPVPPPPPPQPPTPTAGQSGLSGSGPETGGIPGNGQAAKNSATEPAAETIEAEAPRLADPGPKVNNVSNTSLTEVTNGNKESEIGAGTSTDKDVNKAEASFETTTMTATTTTTTTTTQAPSTTTTEAPAVSTTRAPSRLRRIDGSLSSSAWVCAPLVLAASALAYTAVG
ncbi:putative mucin TcMUCII [Trypanosoma cruzi]|uniref:Mucin TcMUCII, putative n=2 Tax=Trypanosoma cruzi TaxID=5693 RepID=Q4D7S5_TRYCC|nr:mucin TcMUCII, putative [Trypanosoma cruzi]EAN88575.1 mucin TcMUCII, putative [Trypanosoma cruzi]PWV21061.1 putative mucin TcMUCII [Trypanosoma cruzi]|eukprot:XP_810426.1 mucin TcMUCII [Trypanosoma cruzi strain CL Brener]